MFSRRIFAAAFALTLATSQFGAAQAQMKPADGPMKMEEHAHKPAPQSTSLALTVAGKTTAYTVADLQAMPQKTVTVHNAHANTEETYTGVLVSDLLARLGASPEKLGNKGIYHSYLKAEGMDSYWVLFSATEIEPTMHKATAIVALTVGGKPIGEDGQFKLVASEDVHPARWVRNLKSLEFVTVDK